MDGLLFVLFVSIGYDLTAGALTTPFAETTTETGKLIWRYNICNAYSIQTNLVDVELQQIFVY